MKASTKVENRTIKRIRNCKSKMLVLPKLANNEEKTQNKGVEKTDAARFRTETKQRMMRPC